MATDTEWHKPVMMDDWGHKTVHAGNPNPRGGGWSSRNSPIPAIGKGKIRVRWPDGTEEEVAVHTKTEHGTVSDMGHSYATSSELPYITVQHHGAAISVLLTDAGCEVFRAPTGGTPT